MTFSVWKFEIKLDGVADVVMPKGARLLTVEAVPNPDGKKIGVFVWAECCVDAPKVTRRFVSVKSGAEVEPNLPYVGTIVLGGVHQVTQVFKSVVAHVYDHGECEGVMGSNGDGCSQPN